MFHAARSAWCWKWIAASLLISCTLTDDGEDERAPICERCTGPGSESTVPTSTPADPSPEPAQPSGGSPNLLTGGFAGFSGRAGSGGTFGIGAGGRTSAFDSGGRLATGGSTFGTGGSFFDTGGATSPFSGGNAAFAGF